MSRARTTVMMLVLCAALSGQAFAVSLSVVGSDGQPVTEFRWLVEEDAMVDVVPGVRDPFASSLTFHKSYMPVVVSGDETNASNIALDPSKKYFISVLPDADYNMGGASIKPGQESVSVTVNRMPLPTAQITVFVFEDTNPINNAPDLPQEQGLEGFKIVLEDAGGRYGASAGQMMTDAFGNMLGTIYDENGDVLVMGDGAVETDADGHATIKNLLPGKYGVIIVPPAGEGWIQTTTIEGKAVIDAWVKPDEPPFMVEFGPAMTHTFFGFVKQFKDPDVFTGTGSISGQIVNNHVSKPPDNFLFYPGHEIGGAWVALNDMVGNGLMAMPCDDEGNFTITDVPPGDYQLVVWDVNLDILISFFTVSVGNGEAVALGKVRCNSWFNRLFNTVFYDMDEDGFPDPGEPPIPEQNVNIRWRDGSIYQAAPTDVFGEIPFEEVFPFFNWLCAEVDFARFKATGATIVVDDGGEIPPDNGWDMPSFDALNPQPQYEADGTTPIINPNTGNNLSRTELGPVLVEGFQGFAGQTNVIYWGKTEYGAPDTDNAPVGNFPGNEDVDQNNNGIFDADNGGISGMVLYGITRAEDDPRYAAAEVWEPGIPRVQVNLYADYNDDKVIDDINGNEQVDLADVDNYPFYWTDPPVGMQPTIGPEDIDRNNNNMFDLGDALNYVTTDSWDDSLPENCQGDPRVIYGRELDCFDGLPNFNQVRPAVFDGGYAFTTLLPGTSEGIPEGYYIVESVAPPGYEHVKEEDRNVDFGAEYTPDPLLLPPICVGDLRMVPNELSLFPGEPCPLGGQMRPLPDRKQVFLGQGSNVACDFFLFTEVPIAGHIIGKVLDDLANEVNPFSPEFGEKFAPPWIPISIRDWRGHEISRVYGDEFGDYNALVPSTFTVNGPMPSGMGPNMLTIVLNDPGPIMDDDPNSPSYGTYITDPFFNRQYTQTAYTFNFMPGTTTYLDTPVLRQAAFAGPDQYPLDCNFPDGTPVVWSVQGPNGGPYVAQTGQQIVIASQGMTEVINPAWADGNGQPQTIMRDFGFGNVPGTVSVNGVNLQNVIWTDGVITGTVAPGTQTGQLRITRANGIESIIGITVTVGPYPKNIHNVFPGGPGTTPIQDAIDLAAPGDMILIAPGNYQENVIVWKPVTLQGWGAMSTQINGVRAPTDRLEDWMAKVETLLSEGKFDLLPHQPFDLNNLQGGTFADMQGPTIFVAGKNKSQSQGGFGSNPNARIDGLTITGANSGGGIILNGYVKYLEISNNNITGNQGEVAGGIRSGHPFLSFAGANGTEYEDCRNDYLRIHNNHIWQNGALNGAGGGISLYTGTDFYEVRDNCICGNFTTADGGGIGHFGYSQDGRIVNNKIIFNQSFKQSWAVHGGGIFVGGVDIANQIEDLGAGSGNVDIIGNWLIGNNAGAGDGGGIALHRTNGYDVTNYPNTPGMWKKVKIFNNVIANNVAGLAGGGISLQDAVNVAIVNNTITHNDSTATTADAFSPNNPNSSNQKPAGIVSRAHSPEMAAAFGIDPAVMPYSTFSNPELVNNIVWENRSFYFEINEAVSPPYQLVEGMPAYWDLGVLGTASVQRMNPMNCILGFVAPYDASNRSVDPRFVSEYFNAGRDANLILPNEGAAISIAAAFDEGGNFIDVRYGPLTCYDQNGDLYGDYHIIQSSPARTGGDNTVDNRYSQMMIDYDGEARPQSDNIDIGADEFYATPPQNLPPVAINDIFEAPFGSVTVGAPGVLRNDYDRNGDSLAAELVTTAPNGIVVLNPNGSFQYFRSNVSFVGTDTFTYRITDDQTNSNTATVTIYVGTAAQNQPPAPSAAPIVTLQNRPGMTRVLPNDPNGEDTHIYAIFDAPNNGTAVLSVNGVVTYTPDLDYLGADTMVVRVQDNRGLNAYVRIDITVQALPETGITIPLQCPEDNDGVDTDGDGDPNNDYVCLHLGAGDGFINMADGRLCYIFSFDDLTNVPLDMAFMAGMLGAEFPAPTLKFKQGQRVYLNLTNVGMINRPDLFDPHTIHFHGFPQAAPVFDGVPDSSIAINMMGTLTYYYLIPDEPGTYMYHCHVEATEHMQMGMLGNCYITPIQDGQSYEWPPSSGNFYTQFAYNDGDGSTGYDIDYPIQLGSFDLNFHDASMNTQPLPFAMMRDNYGLINGRGYPDTINPDPLTPPMETMGRVSQHISSLIEAQQGDRILIRLSNLNVTKVYTLCSPSIPMTVIGRDARQLVSETGEHLYYNTNSITIGGGEARDIILDTSGIAPGTYTLYTTNLNYLSNGTEDYGGMMTEIVISQ